MVADQEIFSKFFAGLELGGFFGWTPARDLVLSAEVGKALIFDQVAFFAGDAEIDLVVGHPCNQRLQTVCRDGFCDFKDGIATGEAEQFWLGG